MATLTAATMHLPQQSPKLRRQLLQWLHIGHDLHAYKGPCPKQGNFRYQSTVGKPGCFVSADGSVIFPCPYTKKEHVLGPPYSNPHYPRHSPSFCKLAVPQRVQACAEADVMNTGIDAVAACRHHLQIIWLAVGVGVSLPAPAAVFHHFIRPVHSCRWDGPG